MKILIRPRRVIIQAFGWSLVDLDVLTRMHKITIARPSGPDPRGTTAAQVEQADEPAPGFGFCCGVRTVVARDRENAPAGRKN